MNTVLQIVKQSMCREWEAQLYPSGTMVVMSTSTDRYLRPWYDVIGPATDNDHCRRDRYTVCKDLEGFLNGGSRPIWIDDLDRISEEEAIGLDGTTITATGPMIDSDPPSLKWVHDDRQEAKDARARLIDKLFQVGQQSAVSTARNAKGDKQ